MRAFCAFLMKRAIDIENAIIGGASMRLQYMAIESGGSAGACWALKAALARLSRAGGTLRVVAAYEMAAWLAIVAGEMKIITKCQRK